MHTWNHSQHLEPFSMRRIHFLRVHKERDELDDKPFKRVLSDKLVMQLLFSRTPWKSFALSSSRLLGQPWFYITGM